MTPAELAHVDVAVAVGLGQAQKGHVDAAAVVEIELGRLLDHRFGVRGVAKIEARGRHAANGAGFQRQRHQVLDLLLGGDRRKAFRHAGSPPRRT